MLERVINYNLQNITLNGFVGLLHSCVNISMLHTTLRLGISELQQICNTIATRNAFFGFCNKNEQLARVQQVATNGQQATGKLQRNTTRPIYRGVLHVAVAPRRESGIKEK